MATAPAGRVAGERESATTESPRASRASTSARPSVPVAPVIATRKLGQGRARDHGGVGGQPVDRRAAHGVARGAGGARLPRPPPPPPGPPPAPPPGGKKPGG